MWPHTLSTEGSLGSIDACITEIRRHAEVSNPGGPLCGTREACHLLGRRVFEHRAEGITCPGNSRDNFSGQLVPQDDKGVSFKESGDRFRRRGRARCEHNGGHVSLQSGCKDFCERARPNLEKPAPDVDSD